MATQKLLEFPPPTETIRFQAWCLHEYETAGSVRRGEEPYRIWCALSPADTLNEAENSLETSKQLGRKTRIDKIITIRGGAREETY